MKTKLTVGLLIALTAFTIFGLGCGRQTTGGKRVIAVIGSPAREGGRG